MSSKLVFISRFSQVAGDSFKTILNGFISPSTTDCR